MKKAYKAFIINLFLLFIFSSTSFAKTNFTSDINSEYSIVNNDTTRVNYVIKLTNLTENFYVSSYSLNLGFSDIQNLKASDAIGAIAPVITKTNTGSSMQFKFNKRVVGLKKTLTFNVSFDTRDVARKLNNVWDINIPGISNKSDYSTFNVTVNYPNNLGIPKFIKPNIPNLSTQSGKLIFSKQDLAGSGISISFGDFQVYDLNLTYHLINKNLFTINTEIALPPNTGYQTVQINNINPRPINVIPDNDGNWIANYTLKPMQKLDVIVSGKAKIYLSPNAEYINDKLKSEYLKPQNFWESNNSKIVNIAKTLKTPKEIYEFVTKTLNYDYTKIEKNGKRLGAVGALQNPNMSVCLEFTDLFIALSRAAGIPAREVEGFAYTTNTLQRPLDLAKDILHAWPEYYDFNTNKWVMVDPTWGKTTGGVDYFNTLDFDHIAFVIKGVSSNYPIPAGGYKVNQNLNSKDVEVSIGNNFAKTDSVDIDMDQNIKLISGINQNLNFKLFNTGNEAINNQKIIISSNTLNPSSQSLISNAVLPFGYQTLNSIISSKGILTNTQDTIKITVENKDFKKQIEFYPFYKSLNIISGGLLIVSFTIIFSIITYAIRRLPIFKQKR